MSKCQEEVRRLVGNGAVKDEIYLPCKNNASKTVRHKSGTLREVCGVHMTAIIKGGWYSEVKK